MSLTDQVKHAIVCLNDPNQYVAANTFLMQWSESREAWQVLDALLVEPSGPLRTFAFIQIYRKIQRDLHQLDTQSIDSFITSLVNHLLRYSNESVYDEKSKYICLSLAASLVYQNRSGVLGIILNWLNPIITSNPLILIQLLISLPEECYNMKINVSQDNRDIFSQELANSAIEVLNILHTISNQNSQNNKVLNQVLNCYSVWIEYVRIPCSEVVAHPLFQRFLELLNHEETFEAAIEVIITLWKTFGCRNDLMTNTLMSRVLELRSLWENMSVRVNQKNNDSVLDIMRLICRVLTETCETCMMFVLNEDSRGIENILQFMILCFNFQYDFCISRIPLKFFYDLSLVVGGYSSLSESKQAFIRDLYLTVLQVSIHQMVIPDSYFNGNGNIGDELEDKRFELSDTIGDCSLVLGVPVCLELLMSLIVGEFERFKSNGIQIRWNFIESILFGAQHIVIDLSEPPFDICSQYIAFIKTIPENMSICLKHTIINFLGKSTRWLKLNQQEVVFEINFLVPTLSHPKLSLVSCKAIMNICRKTYHEALFPEIYRHFQVLRHQKGISAEADSFLIEGLCALIANMDKNSQHQSLTVLLTDLQTDMVSTSSTGEFLFQLESITTLYRFLVIDDTTLVCQFFSQIQPIIESKYQLQPIERVCEKMCRCYKFVMKCCNSGFVPLVPHMTSYLSESFKNTPFSAYIYAAAVCFSCFSNERNGASVPVLFQMFWSISQTFMTMMNSFAQYQKHPDLVEEYYYFVSRILAVCPTPLLEKDVTQLALGAVFALELDHKQARKASLNFFSEYINACLKVKTDYFESVILQVSKPIIDCLIKSMCGILPVSVLDEDHGCVSDVLWNLRYVHKALFQECLKKSLDELPPRQKETARMLELESKLSFVEEKFKFIRLLSTFERQANLSED